MKDKIYDCFMFFNEFEVLDMRLKIMSELADCFVIVESTYTHSGVKKRLYFDDVAPKHTNKKIIRVVVDEFPHDDPWKNENFQRNCINRGLSDAKPNDVVIVSDLDEIPNPGTIKNNLHLLDEVKSFSLKQKLFYFYVDMFHNGTWRGPVISKFKNMKSPQSMRKRRFKNPINNGGWHYSYIGGVDRVVENIEGKAEQEWNTKEFKDIGHIKNSMSGEIDLFKRGKRFRKVPLEGNSPDCIYEFIKKYPYIVSN